MSMFKNFAKFSFLIENKAEVQNQTNVQICVQLI